LGALVAGTQPIYVPAGWFFVLTAASVAAVR
jgi:hypothetical protein